MKHKIFTIVLAILALTLPISRVFATTINFTLQLSSSSVKFNDTLRVTPVWQGNSGNYSPKGNSMRTEVNGQVVGNITGIKMADVVRTGGTYQDISVTAEHGFRAGPNTVQVTLFGSDGELYGTATSPVTVTAGTTGSIENGHACTPGKDTECKSNFCVENSDGTGTCDACDSPDQCNTGGSSGFTCTQGVCVNLSQQTPPSGPVTPPSSPTGIDCSKIGPNDKSNAHYADCYFYNPLPVDSLGETLLLIMRAFMGFLAVWSVAFIMIGGFRYIMSQGNEEAVTAARKTITWAIIGFAIAVLAFSIMAIIQNLLQVDVKDVTSKTSMEVSQSIIKM